MMAESEGSGIFSVESCRALSLKKQGLAWLALSGNQESFITKTQEVGFLLQMSLIVLKHTKML